MFADPRPPLPLLVALLLIGLVGALLAFFTARRSRPAWAFSLSLHGTLSVVALFAAPRLRDMSEGSLALALVPAFALASILILLILAGEEIPQ